jgi:hypothetical protein
MGADDAKPQRLMLAALAAATAGHFVIPLWPRTKVPALHGSRTCPGTGPCLDEHRGWEEQATTDPAQIHRWWATSPFNIAIATGRSGLVVLDLDTADGEVAPEPWTGARHGRDVLARIAAEAGQPMPDKTLTVLTPSGGLHCYFHAPADIELRSTAGRLGWRIDTRGAGGYIVAPGSVRHGRYRVIRRRAIAPLPDWLVQRLLPSQPPPAAMRSDLIPLDDRRKSQYLNAVLIRLGTATPGRRHHALLSAAYTLGRLGPVLKAGVGDLV